MGLIGLGGDDALSMMESGSKEALLSDLMETIHHCRGFGDA